MTRLVKLRPAAERDLDRVVDFLARLDPRAADRREQWLRESLRRLARHPLMGRPGPAPGLRQMTFRYGKPSYLVRYLVTDEAITIARIWHGKENRS